MKSEKDLLVVVDMENGFINEGNLADNSISRIIDNVVTLVEDAVRSGTNIVAFKDTHEVDDEEFKFYPPHCIKGTNECELIPELKVYEHFMHIIEKPTTNGFETKGFKNIINCVKFDNIYVAGCCTDICVYNFVKSLDRYLKDYGIDTNIIVVQDAVDTFNADKHNADEVNERYLEKMNYLGVSVIKTKDDLFSCKKNEFTVDDYKDEI